MILVIDTSSLISLEMIGALRKSFKTVEIIIPEAVLDEIKEIGRYKDREGKASQNILKLIKEGKIKVVKIKNQRKVGSLLSRNVNRGEAECFICCVEQNVKTLIMDDVDAAYELEGLAIVNDIKMKISVAILIELFTQKVLNKKELKGYVKKLIKTREWEGGVIEILSKRYLKNS